MLYRQLFPIVVLFEIAFGRPEPEVVYHIGAHASGSNISNVVNNGLQENNKNCNENSTENPNTKKKQAGSFVFHNSKVYGSAFLTGNLSKNK